jgi:hypothetical protein
MPDVCAAFASSKIRWSFLSGCGDLPVGFELASDVELVNNGAARDGFLL